MCMEMEKIWFAKSAWYKQVDNINYVKPDANPLRWKKICQENL